MKLLSRVFEVYVYSNVHVALAGFCLTSITVQRMELTESVIPWLTGLSILFSYNCIRFADRSEKQAIWIQDWMRRHSMMLYLITGIAGLGLLYILFVAGIQNRTLLWILPLAFMTFFYAVPLGTVDGRICSFRRFPGIKIFSIGLAWAAVTVFLPVVEVGDAIDSQVLVEFIQRACFVIAITIPFDVRDMHWDRKELNTLPQILGLQGVKKVGYALVFVFVAMEAYLYQDMGSLMAIGLVAVLMVWYLSRMTPERSTYFTSFWVESIPIIWFVLNTVFLIF